MRELALRMTAAEMQEWWMLYQIAPWGEERADLRMGISTSALVNMWISKGQRIKPTDFIPDFYKAYRSRYKPIAQAQDPMQMMSVLLQGTKKVGGAIKDGGEPGGHQDKAAQAQRS